MIYEYNKKVSLKLKNNITIISMINNRNKYRDSARIMVIINNQITKPSNNVVSA